ncbi:hypothetical protein ACQJ6P_05340 [Helicobacter pylori]
MASNHSTIQPFNHSIIQSFNHSIIQSFNQAIKQSSNQSTKQSINQSINQPINQSIVQPFKRSSDQATLPYFYHFYQNPLKNPLFFTIPSFILSCIPPFINPHHIFKPFDSISPIFQSVGLTELNSIQGEDDGSVRRFKSA